MVRDLLQNDERFQFREAPLATGQDLRRVHTEDYIQGFLAGTLERGVLRRIGFPWSEGLVKRTLASAGGTLAATRIALKSAKAADAHRQTTEELASSSGGALDPAAVLRVFLRRGFAGTVAGGRRHAFRGEGAGFCVFNDLAIAAEWARQCAGLSRIAIVDLDVHQGDGTASIFENDEGVFTLSLHGARNFPFRKQRSRLDIEFADGAQAEQYFPALSDALEQVWRFQPELMLFQSGVDGLASDRLGRMSLTLADLALRDRLVFSAARQRAIPIAVTMGGGYSDPVEIAAQAHAQTFRMAAAAFA